MGLLVVALLALAPTTPARAADFAAISGRVTDLGGTPVPGVTVRATDCQFCSGGSSTTTDTDGRYRVVLFAAGEKWLRFTQPLGTGRSDDTYRDTPVPISQGDEITGVDMQLRREASIAGLVTDVRGTPLPGVTVAAVDATIGVAANALTGADGRYSLLNLRAGSYTVQFILNTSGGQYVQQYYDHVPTSTGATRVPVAPGVPVAGVDAQLAPVNSITGRVTGAAGQPVAGANVNVYRGSSTTPVTNVTTDDDGRYTLAFTSPAGSGPTDYTVEFWKCCDDEGSVYREFYREAADRSTSTPIVLGSTDAGVSGIDATLGADAPAAPSITGRVTNDTGSPIAGVNVSGGGAFATTGAEGRYELRDVPAGDHVVRFDWWDGTEARTIFYDQVYAESDATPVPVVEGVTTAGIDATFDPDLGGAVSGRVTDEAGQGIAGVLVEIGGRTATTDTDGAYLVASIPPGNHVMRLTRDQDVAYYPGVRLQTEAISVPIAYGITLHDFDVVFPEGPAISGRVTDETGAPLVGIEINLFPDDFTLENQDLVTGADGTYVFDDLVPGSYHLSFRVPATGPEDFTSHDYDIESIVGDGPVRGVDVVFPSATATITGTATDATGSPLLGAYASIQGTTTSGTEYGSSVFTDADGSYRVPAPPGTYTVRISYRWTVAGGGTRSSEQSAEAVALDGSGATAVVDAIFDTTPRGPGVITGRITDQLGRPVFGLGVLVHRADEPYWSDPDRVEAVTDADGRYSIGDLPAGSYVVAFKSSPTANVTRWVYHPGLSEVPGGIPSGATVVTITDAAPRRDGLDIALDLGPSISGRVTDGGQPVAGKLVVARDPNAIALEGHYGYTDADGYYTLYVEPGDYRVLFGWCGRLGCRDETIPVWGYPHVLLDDDADWSTLTVFRVDESTVLTDIDLDLQFETPPPAPLRGRVVDESGASVSGATVLAYAPTDTWWPTGLTRVDPDGTYSFDDLAPGTYRLAVVPDAAGAFATGWYGGTGRTDATDVRVPDDSDAPSVELVVHPVAGLAGRVVDGSGQPVVGATVAAYAPLDVWVPTAKVVTDADGRYRFGDLPPGSYALRVTPPASSRLGSRWLGGGLRSEATTIAVADGQLVEDLEVVIDVASVVSGRVTDTSGTPVDGVKVLAFLPGLRWIAVGSAVTGADGTYELLGLPAGGYEVRFDPPMSTGLARRWYGGADRSSAIPVNIADGGTSAGIDATLSRP